MNIVLWMGSESNQCALANKVHHRFAVAGIVKESRPRKRKKTIKKMLEALLERVLIPSLGSAWRDLQRFYKAEFPVWPEVKTLETSSINSNEVLNFTNALKPDVILVSGTSLIKDTLLEIPVSIGILNLHTGLSPYVKGGPNCTNWCLAEKQLHLIGNTIMWINKGIDTGDILATDFVPLHEQDSLTDLHIRVMNHAHHLYLKTLDSVLAGHTEALSQNEMPAGKTYYTKSWTLRKRIRAVRHFRGLGRLIRKGQIEQDRKNIQLVGKH